MKDKTLVFAVLLGLITFLSSGCMGGDIPGGGNETAAEDGEGISGAAWCQAGTKVEKTYEGQKSTYEIKGMEEYEGEEMCKSVVTTTGEDGEKMRTTMYRNKDGSKNCFVKKNLDNGSIIEEGCVSQQAP